MSVKAPPHESSPTDFKPDYMLDPEQMHDIESQMVADASELAPNSVVVAWVSPLHPYSNLLRSKEAVHFPEVAETDDYYEFNQMYLAIIDTREGGGVEHAAAITFFDQEEGYQDGGRTGFYTIDSLIEHGNFSKAEFLKYYQDRGIAMPSSVSVETNYKMDPDAPMPLFEGLGSADLAYLAIFQWIRTQQWDDDAVAIFATINEKQISSLKRAGINTSPLMDRTDFHTEEEELGKFSMPVLIDWKTAAEIMSAIGMQLPEVHYDK